jgi:hypothetical protein
MKAGIWVSPDPGPRMIINSGVFGFSSDPGNPAPVLICFFAEGRAGMLRNISRRWSSTLLPATLTSALGLDHVCGRIRVAHPAVGIMILKVWLMALF